MPVRWQFSSETFNSISFLYFLVCNFYTDIGKTGHSINYWVCALCEWGVCPVFVLQSSGSMLAKPLYSWACRTMELSIFDKATVWWSEACLWWTNCNDMVWYTAYGYFRTLQDDQIGLFTSAWVCWVDGWVGGVNGLVLFTDDACNDNGSLLLLHQCADLCGLGRWRFMCSAKWSDLAKLRSQTLHLKGLAPVCLR